MKFSELLGEPEPEHDPELPASDSEPISVFAPVPVAPPTAPTPAVSVPPPPPPPPGSMAPPVTGARSGLAELNVRQAAPEAPTMESSVQDQLIGLTEVVDDLLPSGRARRK
jgi:hypothetical protein